MEIKKIDELSFDECIECLNQKDLSLNIQLIQNRYEKLLAQLQAEDTKNFYTCKNIQDYETYVASYPLKTGNSLYKPLYIEDAKLKIEEIRQKARQRTKKIMSWLALIIVFIIFFEYGRTQYVKSSEEKRTQDSVLFIKDSFRRVEEKKIADFNNLINCICQYDYVGNFVNGIANAGRHGKYGYIDLSGKIVIPFKYDYTFPFSDGFGLVCYGYHNDVCGFVDQSGKETVIPKYDFLADYKCTHFYFREGLAPAYYQGKWGYIDTHGNVIIPFQFDGAWHFRDGLAKVKLTDRFGWINKTGELIISFAYSCYPYYSNSNFVEGLACIKNATTQKYGYIDMTGNVVIPCEYDDAKDFSNGLAAVEIETGWGYINKSGNVVIPLEYKDAYDFNDNNIGRIKRVEWQDSELITCKRLIDSYGNEISHPGDVEGYSEGMYLICINDKYGYMDINYNIVIPCKYDYAEEFDKGFAHIYNKKLNGLLYGLINKMGVEIIEPKYDYVHFSEEHNLIRVSQGEKNGVANIHGEIIVPISYNDIDFIRISKDRVLIRAANGEHVNVFDNHGEKLK